MENFYWKTFESTKRSLSSFRTFRVSIWTEPRHLVWSCSNDVYTELIAFSVKLGKIWRQLCTYSNHKWLWRRNDIKIMVLPLTKARFIYLILGTGESSKIAKIWKELDMERSKTNCDGTKNSYSGNKNLIETSNEIFRWTTYFELRRSGLDLNLSTIFVGSERNFESGN